MNTRHIAVALASLLVLSGCGEKRVDTSSEERMEKSIKEVRASVPVADREKFNKCLAVLTTSKLNFAELLAGDASGLKAKVEESLNGKSASEIISAGQAILEEQRLKEEARRIKAEQEAVARRLQEEKEAEARRLQEEQQAKAEIVELTKKKQRAEEAKTELAKFKVNRSRLVKHENSLGMAEPVIELALTNDTKIAVSCAYFMGTLASPGRAVPWLKKGFNYKIPGGMEPGESKELKLAPNMFSDWGKVEAPADAVLTVEVTRLDGPDEKAAFDSETFTEHDAERLKALQTKFPK